ncbi:hypothetical protein [Marinilabilia rubra]|uniref:BioF2-like acetyltransferase domain-containing protein n=1 Tax=Marinilabilia rubra TaxID=2162893 RepID=A0A2U2BBH1_9BACT|nr:hypothetical protein [Marinilabilia rubra]PWE00410.1 hypothetical protein DDZ16_05610 [Marinilabilia rubra]
MDASKRAIAEANETLKPYAINILPRNKIDTKLWDQCVANSINETPMAYTWVLDHLCPAWKGLVINNYKGVMPLPLSGKGVPPIIQMPFDVLNLGIFSSNNTITLLSPVIFHHQVFKKFRYINYRFMGTELPVNHKLNPSISYRKTYELDLNKDYNSLKNAYSKSHKKNIRRFKRNNLEIQSVNHPNTYKLLQQEKAKEKPALYTPPAHNRGFSDMIKTALKNGSGENFEIQNQGEIIGSCFFLKGNKRVVIFHISNETGRKLKTTFGLIDNFIGKHAGEEKILDFAGSSIPSISEFNKGFGAMEKIYLNTTINRLPWPINIIKQKNLLYRFKLIFK